MTNAATAPLSEVEQLIREGLTSRPRWLPMFYLYDERGSQLYEQITRLPEYYLTRTEASILEAHAEEILDAAGDVAHVVELGSGSSRKTRILLRQALARGPVTFHPIDISAAAIEMTRQVLQRDLPGLNVMGHVGDYRDVLPRVGDVDGGARLVLFLGSSIGNYDAQPAATLLGMVRDFLRPQDRFLLGADHAKDRRLLEAAYNDAKGVTAEFNLNLLVRLNRELGADFALDQWAHRAFYNARRQRVEMHLVSLADQEVVVPALDLSLRVAKGETLHTENCQKYTEASLGALAHGSRMRLERRWTDPADWFSVNLLAPA